ncbi:MAG: hypothetical protein QOG44_3354 [Acidimicrobiaceae bacterium]|nr:hypothetical protein [Acidimicrobiaceae bacterium]MDQ1441879.1 hypothetical protein [Acidimicrobiaceae bacterium]
MLIEQCTCLDAHDAEQQAGWVPHHPPGMDLPHPLGAQRFEAAHLRLDVVGFDVEVNPRRVVDPLQQELETGNRLTEVTKLRMIADITGFAAEDP